jgi:hypothetical protein
MTERPNYIDDPAFKRFVEDQKKRLDKLRAENDSSLTAKQTAHLRGQIAEVKRTIKLAEPPVEFRPASNVD